MKVSELREVLNGVPDDTEIHIKWLNPIAPLRDICMRSCQKDPHNKDRVISKEGNKMVLILSPWDAEDLDDIDW